MTALPAPLLPTQRAQWESYRCAPDSTTFGIEVMLRIEGELDVALLAASLEAVRRAQPALRATFHDGPGPDAVQVVRAGISLTLPQADVSGDPDPDAALRRLVTTLTSTPFDLEHGPVLKALLIRLDARDHVLVVSLPRIVVDGWSMGLLVGDIERTYRELASGHAPPVADRTADYLACCAERWQADPGRAVTRYGEWIAGVPRLRTPTDFVRPARRDTAGAEVRVELDQPGLDALTAGARRHRTSLFPLLFTAFAVVLGKRSGQNRFLLNAYVLGRRKPREERLVARFANLVPLPVDLSGDATPAALVSTASRTWWDSFDHHDTLMPALVQRIEPELPQEHLPFGDVAFQFNTGEPVLATTAQPRFRRDREPTTFAPNDLTLFVGPSVAGRFELRLEYRTDLYREDTAWGLLRDYQTVLVELSGVGCEPLAWEAQHQ